MAENNNEGYRVTLVLTLNEAKALHEHLRTHKPDDTDRAQRTLAEVHSKLVDSMCRAKVKRMKVSAES